MLRRLYIYSICTSRVTNKKHEGITFQFPDFNTMYILNCSLKKSSWPSLTRNGRNSQMTPFWGSLPYQFGG